MLSQLTDKQLSDTVSHLAKYFNRLADFTASDDLTMLNDFTMSDEFVKSYQEVMKAALVLVNF